MCVSSVDALVCVCVCGGGGGVTKKCIKYKQNRLQPNGKLPALSREANTEVT